MGLRLRRKQLSIKSGIEILIVLFIVVGAIGQFIIKRIDDKQSAGQRKDLVSKIDKLQETLEEKNQKIAELERRVNVINSLEIRVSFDAITENQPISDRQGEVGILSAVELLLHDKTRFRFVSDLQAYSQQITPTIYQKKFIYRPEEPTQICGRSINFLEQINKFAFNYHDFLLPVKFSKNKSNKISIALLLNGVEVVALSNVALAPSGFLDSGEYVMAVNEAFRNIPEKYNLQLKAKEGR